MGQPVDLRRCIHCHCLAARRRARAITRLYEARLRPHGLRATQFSILAALALMGPRRVGELAARLGLERTTLTRGAAVLEGRGWLAGEAAADRRERRLRLTAEGLARLEAAFPAWQEVQEAIDAQASEATRRTGAGRPVDSAAGRTTRS